MGLQPFQRVLDDHARDVHRFLVAMVGPLEAEDCFQETFISALRAYPRLRPDSNVRGWLLTIAARKAIDAQRARSRRPVPAEHLPDRPGPEPQTPDPDGTPESALGGAELWQAVRELPNKQRAAVVHRYVGGLPYKEIAVAMGGTEEAARRNAHDGVKKLREVWAG